MGRPSGSPRLGRWGCSLTPAGSWAVLPASLAPFSQDMAEGREAPSREVPLIFSPGGPCIPPGPLGAQEQRGHLGCWGSPALVGQDATCANLSPLPPCWGPHGLLSPGPSLLSPLGSRRSSLLVATPWDGGPMQGEEGP